MDKLRLEKLRNATLANLGLTVGSLVVFSSTGNSALVAEALHDGADTIAHSSRYGAERLAINQDTAKFKWFLRGSMLALSALSGYTAVKIGMNINNGVFEEQSTKEGAINLASAAVICAGNTYAYRQLESIEDHSHASEASYDHARVDMLASWGLAGSIALGVAGVAKAPEIGGMVFAGYTSVHLAKHAVSPHEH